MVAIGALTRHHDVANSEVLQTRCPIVADTASQIGDPQVRHVGTIGGSVAHADPGVGPAHRAGGAGSRDGRIRSAGGATAHGQGRATSSRGCSRRTSRANELLTEIRVPKTTRWLVLPEVPPARSGLGPGRRGGGAERRRCTWRSRTWARPRSCRRGGGGAGAAAPTRPPRPPAPTKATAPPSDAFGSAEYRRELSKVLVQPGARGGDRLARVGSNVAVK